MEYADGGDLQVDQFLFSKWQSIVSINQEKDSMNPLYGGSLLKYYKE
jgi:hypothetical protein